MNTFSKELYEEVAEEMDEAIKEIESGDGTDEDIEETMRGLECFIEKCQQMHTACKKRLKK